MKHIILILSIAGLFIFSSCSKSGSEQVEIRFINDTGRQLTDITVNSLPVGDMSVGATSPYYYINGFMQDSGYPDAQFTATANGKRVNSTSQFFWCGTQKARLEPGEYTVRVTMVTNGTTEFFDLTFE